MGISNDAREFLDAAQLVRREKPVWFAPTYFLVCQSIELSLKAYLRGSGYSDKQLRRLGHDLDACVAAARAAGVESHVSFSEADVAAIAVINSYYHSKDLQYARVVTNRTRHRRVFSRSPSGFGRVCAHSASSTEIIMSAKPRRSRKGLTTVQPTAGDCG